jgi:hypothetical protein
MTVEQYHGRDPGRGNGGDHRVMADLTTAVAALTKVAFDNFQASLSDRDPTAACTRRTSSTSGSRTLSTTKQ